MRYFKTVVFALCFPFLAFAQNNETQEAESDWVKDLSDAINSRLDTASQHVVNAVFYSIQWEGQGQIKNYNHKAHLGLTANANVTVVSGDAEKTMTKAEFDTWIGDNYIKVQGETFYTDGGKLYKKEVPLVLIWLIAGAIFFTIYMRFVNIRGFRLSLDIVRGKYTNPDEPGQVSHFQALTTALSGTVGLGNIAGVAVAVAVGGPGATFWMILAGLLGMSTKFVECTLGVKFRNENPDGSISGGPMYYLSKGLKEKGKGTLGKVLAGFFAIMCIGGSFGGGNMFQANQASAQFTNLSWFEGTFMAGNGGAVLFGILMAIAVAIVIIGGIKSIANVTDKIVPFMCGIYVFAALVVLAYHIADIPGAFGEIFEGAFAPAALYGGVIGVLIQGFRRAAFSNEAGIGSAAIAHSAVRTKEPITEGLVALLEPFIDTVVICTMTALVLVITGVYTDTSVAGVEMTSVAFESVFGNIAAIILTLAVVLFAFSTMISWSYYGMKAWGYLFGESKWIQAVYKVIFCVFVFIGAIMALDPVIGFSDAMIFAMCFPNILGLYILSPGIKDDLNSFFARIKSGEIKKYK
ncbi:MAG: alanine:cation symporter family protein [Flavobacteriales bacterium]|nr:alanine:cation symporter family protein [Flavobacteriales bacterium]